MQDIFITAAPVGAVPRRIEPCHPKYLPEALVLHVPGLQAALERHPSWEAVAHGGLVASALAQAADITGTATFTAVQPGRQDDAACPLALESRLSRALAGEPSLRHLGASWFARITPPAAASELVLHLTGQGWKADGAGGLAWELPGPVESYLPPHLADLLDAGGAGLTDGLIAAGWRNAGTGHAVSGKGASCWLPITPEDIVQECAAAAQEGATILHLHTRERNDEEVWALPWPCPPVALGSQANRIVPEDYDAIVPRLRAAVPLALLNLSTSARGGGDPDGAGRREHLKPYDPDGTAPEMSSLSPGEVLFQGGGGYPNTPAFLERQLLHARMHGIRPEIEVFNHTILQETLGPFKARLIDAGTPCLLMLVAGVDQHRRAGDALEDDSLIPVDQRKQIFHCLQAGDAAGIGQALDMTVAALAPIVQEIRRRLPEARISALMPGPMQRLLPRAAVRLGLDGVRTGLEDGLAVPDADVPGGLRKGRTAEQVRWLREELEALGCRVLSAEATRRALHMPASVETLFTAAMEATAHLAPTSSLPPDGPMAAVAQALRPLRPAFERREHWLREQLESLARHGEGDAAHAAATARGLIRQAGLTVRCFIEERERYPAGDGRIFRRMHDIQPLNYAWELLQEAGQDASVYQHALEELATEAGADPGSLLTPEHQRKDPDLRFLEYLASLPCRFSTDRQEVEHLGLRLLPGYNAFMATLFKGMEDAYRRMRARSEAAPKSAGILAFHADTGSPVDPGTVRQELDRSHWVVLPCTTDTHYPEGIRQARKLAATFLLHLERLLPRQAGPLRIIGFVHTGLDAEGEPLIEASLLHHRFLLGADRHAGIVSHASRLLYEALLLPRLVEQPERLLRTAAGTVARNAAGLALYEDGSAARRIDSRAVADSSPLRFLAHSSGIAALQQMDNAMREDMDRMGYSLHEQAELFNRNVVVSFASTADIHHDLPGTPVVDITAYNDLRSMAGTTTPDYVIDGPFRRQQARRADSADHRYDGGTWKLIQKLRGRTVLRRTAVFLRHDPAGLDDGHSLRRYLEGAPEAIAHVLAQLHQGAGAPRFDFTLQRLAPAPSEPSEPRGRRR